MNRKFLSSGVGLVALALSGCGLSDDEQERLNESNKKINAVVEQEIHNGNYYALRLTTEFGQPFVVQLMTKGTSTKEDLLALLEPGAVVAITKGNLYRDGNLLKTDESQTYFTESPDGRVSPQTGMKYADQITLIKPTSRPIRLESS